jgi:hypothetical protein
LTPLQIRAKLIDLAAGVIPPDAVERVKDLLALQGTPNGGTGVTDDLKYNSTELLPSILPDISL